jgi:hypothetical protein
MGEIAMHVIYHDENANRLYVKMVGFWQIAEATHLHRSISEAVSNARRRATTLSMMSDLTEYATPGTGVSAIARKTADMIREGGVSRYAIVTHSALQRVRMRRLLPGIAFDLFSDITAAETWLGWPRLYALEAGKRAGFADVISPAHGPAPRSACGQRQNGF